MCICFTLGTFSILDIALYIMKIENESPTKWINLSNLSVWFQKLFDCTRIRWKYKKKCEFNTIGKKYRSWQDSNLQSSDPKSDALSIRPHDPPLRWEKMLSIWISGMVKLLHLFWFYFIWVVFNSIQKMALSLSVLLNKCLQDLLTGYYITRSQCHLLTNLYLLFIYKAF